MTSIRNLVLASAVVGVVWAGVAPGAHAGEAWWLFKLTNHSRAHHHVGHLRWNQSISHAAEHHARTMARRHRLFHTRGAGRYGRACYAWAENVGWTTGGVRDLERAFMRSPDHRQHILSDSFRRVGVGVARAKSKLWVTVFFCT